MNAAKSKWGKMPLTERLDAIQRVWQRGMSAGQIASALRCDATRNSIIGLFHRHEQEWMKRGMFLTAPTIANYTNGKDSKGRRYGKPKPEKKKREPKFIYDREAAEATAKAFAAMQVPVVLPIYVPPPPPGGVMLKDLAPHQCRWALTDLKDRFDVHMFCAAETAPGKVYCEAHAKRARHQWYDRQRETA